MKAILSAAALVAGLVSLSISDASAGLVNAGFETGDLTGWTTLGSVSATPSTSVTTYNSVVWSIMAAGTTMAHLDSNNVQVSSIESTLGLTAGSLVNNDNNPNGGADTDGSAIYQVFSATSGDVIQEYYNYVARDYIPFNDPAYAIVIDPLGGVTITVLASIQGDGVAVGTSGNTGWQLFNFTAGLTGNYTLAFVTTNDKDQVLDSALFLDDTAGSCNPDCPTLGAVPEPSSLPLLGTGLAILAVAALRRRFS